VIAGVVIGAGVAIGMGVSGSEAANATKYAADRAADAQKYSADQTREASDHQADLLFKTEQADREQDAKYAKEDAASEKQMMSMFDLIDSSDQEAGRQVDEMGSRHGGSHGPSGPGDEYSYPEPCGGGDDMIFS
jgi:hypothetical protein